MEYRVIERTGLNVSRLCLGTWVFGGECWGKVDDRESGDVVRKALDSGVNIIDTSPVYGDGRAEEVVGRVLRDRAGCAFIAGKTGLERDGKKIRVNLTPGFIKKDLEGSLRRLGADRVDILQCHWPDPATPFEDTARCLSDLKRQGKIGYFGVSNFGAELLEEAARFGAVSAETRYSLLDKEAEEALMPFCAGKGIAVLAYGALGGGILTGKYTSPPGIPKGDVRSFFYRYYREPFWTEASKVLAAVRTVSEKRNAAPSTVAINWVLSRPSVTSCLAGCRNTEQLRENLGFSGWQLDEDDKSILEGAVRETGDMDAR